MDYRRIIPVLLIKEYGLVKTRQFKNPRYVGDPINAVKIFNECEADELIILGIDNKTLMEGPDFGYIEKITNQCFMPLCYGGGVRSIDDMKRLYYIGIEKIAINTMAFFDPDFIRKAAGVFGSQSIVGSMDVRVNRDGKTHVYVRHARHNTGIAAVEYAKYLEDIGVGEILLNIINRDGMRNGYDTELIEKIADVCSIPIIACGGANKIDDCYRIIERGAGAAAAGSMFVFWGRNEAVLINYPNRY